MLNFFKAELSDCEHLSQLINSAYRGEPSRQGWTTEADILDGVRTTTADLAKIVQSTDQFILMGELNQEIVACMHCQRQTLSGHPTAHFGMIAVKPTLQNKGHGKDLVAAAEAMTKRQWRAVGFYMVVISIRTEVIAFYERLGYERTGEFVDFPINPDKWQPKVAGLNLQYLAKLVGK
jgi:ribosomal protein S18 acetylase RimI-like enzyme